MWVSAEAYSAHCHALPKHDAPTGIMVRKEGHSASALTAFQSAAHEQVCFGRRRLRTSAAPSNRNAASIQPLHHLSSSCVRPRSTGLPYGCTSLAYRVLREGKTVPPCECA